MENSYHILLAPFLLWYRFCISWFCELCRQQIVMEGEWHILHHIEEVSNLISLSREYEANTITRNATRCNNCYNLFNLSFYWKFQSFQRCIYRVELYGAAFFAKIVSGFFAKKLHHRCSTGFQIRLYFYFKIIYLKTLKYWVGVQRSQPYPMGRRYLFSLGWRWW